jgi:transposase InsO family protein
MPPASAVVTQGRRSEGVYELHTDVHKASATIAHPFQVPSHLAHLHNIFNHRSARDIRQLLQRNPILKSSILNDTPRTINTCTPCLEGKQTRTTFYPVTTRAPHVLARVSTDLCGPLPLSLQGARYLQIVIDEKSQYAAGLLLARKSEAPTRLAALLNARAVTTGHPVKTVLSDNAKELTCKTLQDFYMKKGITPLTTTPYSSSQNGRAERALRTIQNAVSSALSQSKLPTSYWDYAALDAITKGNSQPSSTNQATPYNDFHNTASVLHPVDP